MKVEGSLVSPLPALETGRSILDTVLSIHWPPLPALDMGRSNIIVCSLSKGLNNGFVGLRLDG